MVVLDIISEFSWDTVLLETIPFSQLILFQKERTKN